MGINNTQYVHSNNNNNNMYLPRYMSTLLAIRFCLEIVLWRSVFAVSSKSFWNNNKEARASVNRSHFSPITVLKQYCYIGTFYH